MRAAAAPAADRMCMDAHAGQSGCSHLSCVAQLLLTWTSPHHHHQWHAMPCTHPHAPPAAAPHIVTVSMQHWPGAPSSTPRMPLSEARTTGTLSRRRRSGACVGSAGVPVGLADMAADSAFTRLLRRACIRIAVRAGVGTGLTPPRPLRLLVRTSRRC